MVLSSNKMQRMDPIQEDDKNEGLFALPMQTRGEEYSDCSSSDSLTPTTSSRGVSLSFGKDFQMITPGDGRAGPILVAAKTSSGSGRSPMSDPFTTPGHARTNAVAFIHQFDLLNSGCGTDQGTYPLSPPGTRQPQLCNLPHGFEQAQSPKLSLESELTRAGIFLPVMQSYHNAGPTGIVSVGNPHPQAPPIQGLQLQPPQMQVPQMQVPQVQVPQGYFPQPQNPYVHHPPAYCFPAQGQRGPGPQMPFHPMGYHHVPQGGAFQPVQMSQPQWYQNPASFSAPDQAVGPRVLPFAHLTKDLNPPQWGVIKIENLPYSVTKQEIVQFLGRHARLLPPEVGCAVHIIMERSTAKTMDAYVEFLTPKDAEDTVRRLNSISESGRPPRLGHRHVDVTLSSQDALLKDLFPRAKCIEWRGGYPILVPNTDPYSSGYKGFLTSEEILGVVRHAEQPHRSPFSAKCSQRTYESMISTIWKYPWYATNMFTVEDRDNLYQAVKDQMMALTHTVNNKQVIGLDEKLVMNLLRAGCLCPAFNERMKFSIICASEQRPLKPISVPSLMHYWPFDTLMKHDDTSEGTMMIYAGLIRQGLEIRGQNNLLITNNWRNVPTIHESPYGNLFIEWNLHDKKKKFEDAAQLELQVAKQLVLAAMDQNLHKFGLSAAPCSALPMSTAENTRYEQRAARRAAINDQTPSRQPRNSESPPLDQALTVATTGNPDEGASPAAKSHPRGNGEAVNLATELSGLGLHRGEQSASRDPSDQGGGVPLLAHPVPRSSALHTPASSVDMQYASGGLSFLSKEERETFSRPPSSL